MLSLLFITPELPFPAQSGGKLKSLKTLEHLSTQYEVTLCCPLKEDDASYLDEFKAQMPSIQVLSDAICVKRNIGNLLKSYWRSEPLNVYRTASSALKLAVTEVADDFDVIFLDHYEVAQYVPESYLGSVIYHGHNAYYKLWETYSKSRLNPFYKLATLMEARRVKRYESRVAKRADLVLAAHDDLIALREAGVTDTLMSETYHLGDESQLALPAINWYETEFSLVYIGFLGWEANSRGLIWFIQHVWPKLLHQYPNMIFRIMGKNPDNKLRQAVAKTRNIELLGFVEDPEQYFSKAHVCVAPLTFGSGMKVKVLSAMARGIPVVTTPIGAESIRANHREHLMISKTASAMAQDIDELFHNRALWNKLAIRSRELIVTKYSWAKLFFSMDRAMNRVLSRTCNSAGEDKHKTQIQTPQLLLDDQVVDDKATLAA